MLDDRGRDGNAKEERGTNMITKVKASDKTRWKILQIFHENARQIVGESAAVNSCEQRIVEFIAASIAPTPSLSLFRSLSSFLSTSRKHLVI